MKKNKILALFLAFLSFGILKAQQNDPPNWTWAKLVDGTVANHVTDTIGNTYLVGNHSSNITFGSTTLTGTGLFVVKYDSSGVVLWARQALVGTSIAKSITIDPSGNYYICGSFNSTVTIGGLSRTSSGVSDAFVAKFNAAGAVQFAQQAGGTSSDIFNDVSLTADGNVIAAGNLKNASSIDQIHVFKYNSIGTLVWEKVASSFNNGGGNGVHAVDNDQFGNTYITGSKRNQSSQIVFFIQKLDPEGNSVWDRLLNGSGVYYPSKISLVSDNTGNTYVSGTYTSSVTFESSTISSSGLYDAFLVKYDGAGKVVWVKSAGGVDNDYGDDVVIDKLGNAYLTGRFQQNALFSTIPISNLNSGLSDVYVAKYSALGEILWVQTAGDFGADGGVSIALDKANNCFVNGTFTSTITIEGTTLNSATSNAFFAKIGSNVEDTLAIFTNALNTLTYTAGSAIDISFITTGNFNSNTVFTAELSDASGGFFYPTEIGTGLVSPINAVIPPSAVISSNYRVRIVSSNPDIVGNDNGSDISINNGSQQVTPDWDWANKLDGKVSNVVTDTTGASYVLGNYTTNVTFGSTTLTGSGTYVVKYDATGSLIWARSVAAGSTTGNDVTIDASGNYYVTGSFSSTGNFGGFSLTSAGLTDLFVVKYNDAGTAQWAQKAGGTSFDVSNGITVDLNANVFIVGNVKNASSFDEINVLKYNSTGILQWTKVVSTVNTGVYNDGRAISHDRFGNSYVTGSMRNSGGSPTLFIAKLDPTSTLVWNRQTVMSFYAQTVDLKTDKNGNSFITSSFYNSVTFGSTNLSSTNSTSYDMFLVKYDAAGQVVWAKSAGGYDNDYGDGIDLDPAGNCYVTGRFQHSAYYGGINISNFNSGVADVFVAKYDNSGNALWVKQAGETGAESASKIGVDKFGNSFVSGLFTNSINFDGNQLSGTVNSSYLAKIGSTYQTSIGKASIIAGLKICSGNVFKIQYPVSGVFGTNNVFTAQLSDENGSFASPTEIGNLTSNINNTIYAIIPDVVMGTNYRIRVVSSDVALVGLDNGYDLSINMTNCDSVSAPVEVARLVGFEYFFDTDNGVGTYVEIPVASNDSISMTHSITVAGLSPGFHNLFIRFKDSLNVWSLYEGRVIYVQPVVIQTQKSRLIEAEYFFDTDPGVGNGTALASFAPADSISLIRQISVSGLSSGFHNLFIRTKDSLNIWSLYEGRVIYVQPTITVSEPSRIVAAEYFFNSDPGVGNGFALASFSPADSIDITRQISASGLANGFNNLFIRTKDSLGIWSLYEGRKFFICADVLATPVLTGNSSICENSTINYTGSTVTNATSYLWTGPSGFTQTGQTLTRTNASPSMNGIYTFYAIRSGGTKCDTSFASVTITVNPIFTTNNPQSICEGDFYTINGNNYSISGSYRDTLMSINGCDSVIVTQLTVVPTIHADNFQNLCGSATYTFNGNTYSISGTYIDTVQTINGCDSIVTTYLNIFPEFSVNNPQTICTGGSFAINGNTYTVAGTYVDVLQTINGCDSTVTTQLTVVNSFNSTNPQVICEGETYAIGVNSYTIAGTYTDILTSTQGCDSIVTTVLTVNPTFNISNPQSICQGGTYSINGNSYTVAGIYTDVFQTINGCDSIVITDLTVNPIYNVTNPQAICQGSSYTIGSSTYTSPGTYVNTLQSVNGCDSIVTTILTVNPIYNVNNPQTICQGSSYSIGTSTYTASGTYVNTLQSINGCDSIVTTILTVNPIYNVNNPQTICQGGSYSIGTSTYTTAGTYANTLQSVNGCDSIVTTVLTVNPIYNVNNSQTICFGDSYTINGHTYTTSGTYTDLFQTINGCDSTVVTSLTVRANIVVSNPQTICQGSSYTIGLNTYTTAGTYQDLLTSVNGCDSTVNTILTVNNPTLNTNVSISADNHTLSSLENNATYQWVNCANNFVFIGGATNQDFTPIANGNYAVILTSLTCNVSDTSNCFTISNVGIENLSAKTGISIFPNPTKSNFEIKANNTTIERIQIFNAEGKLIFEQKPIQNTIEIDAQKWSDGVYWIEIYTEQGIVHEKIVKQ